MNYESPPAGDLEQLKAKLVRSEQRAKLAFRALFAGMISAASGVIAFAFIPDTNSIFADVSGLFFGLGLIVLTICSVFYSGWKYEATVLSRQMEKLTKLAKTARDESANGVVDEPPDDYWLQNRVRPLPQPYGVSDEGAEHLAAQWLQYLGFEEATVTQYSGDGGIDVETLDYVCQVKNYRDKSVSVTEVRELFGVAASERKRAILFTSTGATTQAIEFADKNEIALIRFDAKTARLEEINDEGSALLVNGEYEEA